MSSLKYLFGDLQHSAECYEWYARKGFCLGNLNSCLEMSKGYLSSVNRKNFLNTRCGCRILKVVAKPSTGCYSEAATG